MALPRYELFLNRHGLPQGSPHEWTYARLDEAQRERHARLLSDPDTTPGAVFISEVAPVITLGRRECSQDLLLPASELERRGISLYSTDRGGRATYHGPGQWVVFVVDRLDRLTGDPRGVRRAVEGLLDLALELGREELGQDQVEIRGGDATGVWTHRGKLASVGVHIQKGILLHGLAINGLRTEQSFVGLKPCGLDAQVDFLFPPGSDGAQRFGSLPERILSGIESRFWLSR